jgi:hypothetical protein
MAGTDQRSLFDPPGRRRIRFTRRPPAKSLPSINCTGFPHFGTFFSVQVRSPHACPLPTEFRPARSWSRPAQYQNSLPSKTMSSFLSSSSLGETNVMWSFEIAIFGSGRACPPRLTIRALNCPSSRVISSRRESGFLPVPLRTSGATRAESAALRELLPCLWKARS